MVAKNDYPRASEALVFGGILSFVAGMLLLMAFASPYWFQSFHDTFSDFKHMGLWEYCFDNFRYPYYQFTDVFDGCHYIFGNKVYVIREWLLPGWLMVVQAFVTLGLMLSFAAQIIIALEIVRWPLKFILRYEYMLSGIAFFCNATCACLLFLAVAIFGGQCWRRDWMMYPVFNYLSWSYGMACLAMIFHGIAAAFVYMEVLPATFTRTKLHDVANVHFLHPKNGGHVMFEGTIPGKNSKLYVAQNKCLEIYIF